VSIASSDVARAAAPRRRRRGHPALLASLLLLPIGCFDTGDSKTAAGFVTAADGPFGPSVVFDPLRRPVPEIPFPNDVILISSDDNDAGHVWNISTAMPTRLERGIRERLNTLDGFGTFAPIFVSFDGPIDLDTVTHDTVLLINIEPGHPREGARELLDLGDGYFPIDSRGTFWAYDEAADLPDFLLPADNDALFRGELQRVTHYEVATHTLILRPVMPLDPGARYAVLILRGVHGERVGDDGLTVRAPVRSPFPYKAHAAQTRHIEGALGLAGLTPGDLAFGWTFTTQDTTRPLRRVREGLYGAGPLAHLARDFAPTLGEIRDTGIHHDADGDSFPFDPQDSVFTLQGEYVAEVLGLIVSFAGGLLASFDNVDYVVFGSLPTPDIRTGLERTLGVNADTGQGSVGVNEVPYLIAVPRATERHQPPFPVVFYFHGTGTSRFEFIALADNLARQGIATIAFDQVGHGPIIPDIRLLLAQNNLDPAFVDILLPLLVSLIVPDRVADFEGLSFEEGFDKLSQVGFFAELALIGRTEDATGDGALQSGESFFFADPFKQCAAFLQDMVDFMQFVRVIRSLDPAAVPPPPAGSPRDLPPEALRPSLLAGDFNADGVLDIGGPDVPIGVAGTSLGGIHSVLVGAVEPEVSTITPIVAGGGLSDILLRSSLRQITRVIYHEVFGPLVVGCPDGEGGLWLSFNDDSDRCRGDQARASFARLPGVGAGARVRVDNLANGQHDELVLAADGDGFSLAIESDRWDQLAVTVERPDGGVSEVLVQTPYKGLGGHRNTPDFRRKVGINQHALDRCDPIAYARHLFLEPLPGHAPKSVLYATALQDSVVPISTGVSLARATGVLGRERSEWGPLMEDLIARGVLVGSDFDVDDLAGTNSPEAPALGPLAPVPSGAGVSSIRFASVGGKHEWIAGSWSNASIEDPAMYTRNQLALFHLSQGRVVVDDLCIQREECELLDDPLELIPGMAP